MAVSGKKTVTEDWSDEDAAAINEITLTPFQAVTDIELNIPENKIMQKKSYDLGSLATVKPETAPNKTIKWSVKAANDGVTLGEDGTLTVSDTAVVGSTVTLTATIAEGALSSDGMEKAEGRASEAKERERQWHPDRAHCSQRIRLDVRWLV